METVVFHNTSEGMPPEWTPVMARLSTSPDIELPVVWSGEVWYRAWPYADGRWHWWSKERWDEWRPMPILTPTAFDGDEDLKALNYLREWWASFAAAESGQGSNVEMPRFSPDVVLVMAEALRRFGEYL